MRTGESSPQAAGTVTSVLWNAKTLTIFIFLFFYFSDFISIFFFFYFWTMKRYMTLQSHDMSHDVMS